MLTLVMMLCMVGDPDRCRTYKLTIAEENVGLMACMMASPKIIAQWAIEHPGVHENFYVRRWKCEFNSGKDI